MSLLNASGRVDTEISRQNMVEDKLYACRTKGYIGGGSCFECGALVSQVTPSHTLHMRGRGLQHYNAALVRSISI